MKDLSPDDRPREKLILKGRNSLSDSELIAIILGSGSRNKTALELSQEILNFCGNDFNNVCKLTFHDFKKFKGVGDAKAVSLVATFELGRRRKTDAIQVKTKVKSSKDVYEYLRADFQDLKHEECYIVLLDRGNQIMSKINISKGGFSATIVDSKIIFKHLIDNGASSFILAHNHPSGLLFPSNEDKILTEKIKNFGKMIDLPLLDHLILTDNNYFSFCDSGEF